LESHDNVVRNNVIHGTGKNSTRYGYAVGLGLLLSSGTGNTAYNNVVYANNGGGIDVDFGATDSTVFNNTVVGNIATAADYAGVYVRAANTTLRNNISYGNGGGDLVDVGTGTVQDHNLF